MGDVLVLCYHAVSPSWPAPLSVLPERLDEQLELLVGRGYRGVTFTEAVTWQRDDKALAVTFDDAYTSTLRAGPSDPRAAWGSRHRLRPHRLRGQRSPDRLGRDGALARHRARARAALHDDPGAERAAGGRLGGGLTYLLPPDAARAWPTISCMRSCRGRRRPWSRGCPRPVPRSRTRMAPWTGGWPWPRPRRATRPRRPWPLHAVPLPPHRWPRVGTYHTDSLSRFKLKVSPSARRLRLAEARTAIRSALGR